MNVTAIPLIPLAQAGESSPVGTIVTTLFVLVVVALLIGGVAIVRKRMFGKNELDGGALSIGGLRDLVRQGKMTQEEFDATKAQIVAAAQKKAALDAVEVKPESTRPKPRRAAPDDDFGEPA